MQVRILVAEDNVINQKVASRMLEKLGHQVDVAANGEEAITAVADGAYHICFMDCLMPEVDGYTATKAIRVHEKQTGEHLPIIAMTANAMPGDRERCLEAGMDDFLCKPVRVDELSAVIDRWRPSPSHVSHPPSSA